MMPQKEADESMSAQESASYGRYEADHNYNRQRFDTPYQPLTREEPLGKVYAQPSTSNPNVLRLIALGMSLVALIALAVICLVFVGGTGGWISFCAASLALFIVAVVAIDKIK